MVWPTADIPTYGRGVWLECNGQSFSTTQFPQLYETLGTNRVPDYQGVFLRGYGTRDFTQLNGYISSFNDGISKTNDPPGTPTKTTHLSGDLGEVQGDSVRDFYFPSEYTFYGVDDEYALLPTQNDPGQYWYWRKSPPGGTIYATNKADQKMYTTYTLINQVPFRYKYSLVSSSSGEGENATTTYTLQEDKEYLTGDEVYAKGNQMNVAVEQVGYGALPVANEIRPVNVAVKFMIKAK